MIKRAGFFKKLTKTNCWFNFNTYLAIREILLKENKWLGIWIWLQKYLSLLDVAKTYSKLFSWKKLNLEDL